MFAQLVPLQGSYYNHIVNKNLYCIDSDFHSAFKPIYVCDIKHLINEDSIPLPFSKGLLAEYTNDNDKYFFFHIIPLLNLSGGIEKQNNSNLYNIGGGVFLNAGIDNRFGLSLNVNNNFLNPLSYNIINKDSLKILHSDGFITGSNPRLYNSNNSLTMSWRPYEFIMFETGFSNHFFGDGYRSLLLSDNSYNYPYFKLETNFLNIKYSIIWAQFKNIGIASSPVYSQLQSKYAVMHYFDWKISRRLSIGIFESIIMHQDVGFDINYINPVIFFRPVEFYLGSHDNAMMGLNIKMSINSKNILYSQIVVDDIVVGLLMNDIKRNLNIDFDGNYGWFANKWAIQGGYKTFDLFGLTGLSAFGELNISRPYMYSHVFVEQNYSHFGQALAHPLGANFAELVAGLDYFNRRFSVSFKHMYARTSYDSPDTHYGQDIFKPTMDGNQGWPYIVQSYENILLQGHQKSINTSWLHCEFIINHSLMLAVNAGLVNRYITMENYPNKLNTSFYIGIKSGINNLKHLH